MEQKLKLERHECEFNIVEEVLPIIGEKGKLFKKCYRNY
jgi:hypothetical protein